MKFEVFEGKEEKEVLTQALETLKCTEEDIVTLVEKSKSGLLKKETVSMKVFKMEDITLFIKDYLHEITKGMGLDVSFESKIRDRQISIKMYSNNYSILIGHNGQTLKALTTIVKQVVYNEIKEYPYLLLDVENYKEKQEKYLERLARNVARDVERTKVEVELENMNSYERRIIHNALTDNKHVYTESIGEEPNRHIVIKPKNSEE